MYQIKILFLLISRALFTSVFTSVVILSLAPSPLCALEGDSESDSGSSKSEISWKPLSNNVHLGIARLPEYGFLPGEITLIRVSTKDYVPRVVRAVEYNKKRASVAFLSRHSTYPICINASFFDKSMNPLGLVVSKGMKHNKMHRGGSTLTGVFLSFRDKNRILQRSAVDKVYGLEAVQAGPRLVVNGKITDGLKPDGQRSRRSGVCLTDNNDLILFALTSALRGASLFELSKILVQKEVGCQEALNLDGGGSSQFFVSKELPGATESWEGINFQGRDNVPVALCLDPQTRSTGTL